MAKDYFCNSCKQLRLWLVSDEDPDYCRNCGSRSIEVDVVGSPRLTKLYPVGYFPGSREAVDSGQMEEHGTS